VVVVMLCAADFWTVKNVTGRLLVGLRWWNEITESGESKWSFESRADRSTVHRGEMVVFWAGMGVFTFAWFIFSFKNVFTLSWDWLVVDLICLSMNCANLFGYLKCANAARSLSNAATNYAVQYAVSNATGRMTSNGGGGAAPQSSSSNVPDFN
jgi:hypothetical protein